MRNIDTAQGIYAAMDRGDVPFILDQLADDVAWESWTDNSAQRGGVPWMAPRAGKAEALGFFQLLSTFTIHELSVLDLMSSGHQVAVEFILDATPPGGTRYRDEEIHLWTFNEAGKVTRFRHYADTAKHLRAAGKAV